MGCVSGKSIQKILNWGWNSQRYDCYFGWKRFSALFTCDSHSSQSFSFCTHGISMNRPQDTYQWDTWHFSHDFGGLAFGTHKKTPVNRKHFIAKKRTIFLQGWYPAREQPLFVTCIWIFKRFWFWSLIDLLPSPKGLNPMLISKWSIFFYNS